MVSQPTAQHSTEENLHKAADEVPLIDILSLAENSIENLKNILDTFDARIYSEFREIADQISLTRTEIGQLNATEIKQGRIPEAGNELKAIIDSTEDATHKIMESAETIMTADPSDQANYYTIVNENIMTIFEACSFQDITGQRISRVVDTLEFIDKRVSRFASKMNVKYDADQENEEHYIDDEERQKAQRKKDLLLHGPQDDQTAVSQNEIDFMLKNR